VHAKWFAANIVTLTTLRPALCAAAVALRCIELSGTQGLAIVVERNNIVIDGAGYTVQGIGNGKGIDLISRSNVKIQNMEIAAFAMASISIPLPTTA